MTTCLLPWQGRRDNPDDPGEALAREAAELEDAGEC
jgi:hypothetical protein